MDWTAVFEETGEEEVRVDDARRRRGSTAPRLARLVSTVYHHQHRHNHRPRKPLSTTTDQYYDEGEEIWQEEEEEDDDECYTDHRIFMLLSAKDASSRHHYTLRALYFLSINYILGVGCLGVPYAFAKAGFVLCSFIVVIVTFISYLTVLWVAEVGERLKMDLKQRRESTFIMDEGSGLLSAQPRAATGLRQIDAKRFEVVDLVSYFLGPVHQGLYQVSLMGLMYVGLLAYTQVFCGSLAAILPIDELPLGVTQGIFALIVIPLSCMELDEQISIQGIMALVRFLAIFIMVGGSVVALLVDRDGSQNNEVEIINTAGTSEECNMYTACFSGFGVAFSTALFSQLFQHSVPGLVRPLRSEQLPHVPKVFGAALLTTCSFYLLLGISAATYFRSATKSSVNLNFSSFLFGLDPDSASPILVAALSAASNLVVIFPALDTLSVFPLIANTLGNNLMASCPEIASSILTILHKMGVDSGPQVEPKQQDSALSSQRHAIVSWRLVSAIPPLVGSVWATDLSFSLLLAGVAGLYVAFVAPALLHWVTIRRSYLQSTTTTYSGWHSWPFFVIPVLLFACFALIVVLVQIREAVIDILLTS